MVISVIEKIKSRVGNSPDFIVRELDICNDKISLLFFETLTDTNNISDFVLKYLSYIKTKKKFSLDLAKYIKKYIPTFKIIEIYTIDEVINLLFSGFVVLNIKDKYYSMEVRRQLDSGITKAESEKTIRGPKDAFTENYQTNIGLVRKRIRNENLWLEEFMVGKKSNTKIGIMYINDIANKGLVENIKYEINNIDIDSIPDSTYIYDYFKKNKSLFPNVLLTERPDLVSYKLLSGKIAIIVDNTPYVLLIPAFFMEFFHTMDDYFQNTFNSTYIRIIRIIAFITTVMLPGFYIALITYNYEIVPPNLLINFAMQKEGVPFPTILEAVLMNIIFEILRETDIRAPSTLGSALSIVGALVLGDAAVEAGLVSPIMVIVIAITAISELIFSINDVSNAAKIWRLVFILFASFAGMLGIFIAIILLVSELVSIDSFDYPYMYPSAPFNLEDQNNNIVLTNNYKLKFRNRLTSIKNIIRGVR